MLLSDRDLRAAIVTGAIGLDPLHIACVQPSSIDLRLGHEFRAFRKVVDVIDTRCPPDDLTEVVEIEPGGSFVIYPGEFVLGTTLEVVTLSDSVAVTLEGRSSLGRLGLEVHRTAGIIDPGFDGHITLELGNTNMLPLRLWPGDRVAQLLVWRLSSPAEAPYGSPGVGRYQGQRGPTPSLGVGG